MESYPGAQSIARAIALLKSFDDGHIEWGLGELSEHLDLNKTTTHRLLAALENEGLIMRAEAAGRYRLGPELITLGGCAMRSNTLRNATRPELETLARSTGETAFLEILVGDRTLILDEAMADDPLSISQDIGAKLPLHATSTGKLLLAHLPPDQIDDLLGKPLTPLTAETITDADELRTELNEIRRNGYATTRGEFDVGFVSVAAPILDSTRTVIAALGIGGPALRLTAERLPAIVATLQVTAQRVSRRLGYRVV